MPNILKRYGYYSIFFAISGIIHYYLCFYNPLELEIIPKLIKITPGAKYQFKVSVSNSLYEDLTGKIDWKATGGIINNNGAFIAGKTNGKFKVIATYQKLSAQADVQIINKVIKISAATLKALAIKKKAKEKPVKKKVVKKKKEPKKIDEKKKKELEKIRKKIYRENLEKKLKEAFEKKFKELMKKQAEDLKKLKEQNEKKFDELKKKNQKDVEKLQKEKDEYKKNNQLLRKHLAKYDKAIKDLKKDQQKKLQQTQKDINNLKEKHSQKLAAAEKQYKDKIQKQQNNLTQLSNALMLLKAKQAKQQTTIKKLQEQKTQQKLSQKQLEQKILVQKKLREKAKKISKTQERAVIKQQWKSLEQIRTKSLEQHKQLVRKFSTNSDKGEAVPSLSFFDTYFKNNLSKIINFHKMKLVAYPETRDFFISIDLDRPYGHGKYRKRTDFSYFRYFSNRAIAAERGFPSVVREICNDPNLYHPMNGHLSLAFIFPQSTADYLAWKSVTVCKKHGYNPKNVAVCYGYFQQKANGFWSFIITKLRLTNGQTVKVDDFEKNW